MKISLSQSALTTLRRVAKARKQHIKDTVYDLVPLAKSVNDPRPCPCPVKQISLKASAHISDEELSQLFEGMLTQSTDRVRRTDGIPDVKLSFQVDAHGNRGVKLPNGRVLFESGPTNRSARIFPFFKDLAPKNWTVEEYHLSSQVRQRYLRYVQDPGIIHFPSHAKVAVDAGAYIGWKAIAFADIMGADSTTVAIEIDKSAYELMCRNVKANNLEGRVIPIYAAIGENNETTTLYRRGSHGKNSVVVPVENAKPVGQIETRALESIFSDVGLRKVDYLNLQLNGAEAAALSGLGGWRDRVRTVFAATPYNLNGAPTRPTVVRELERAGFSVVDEGKPGRVIAQRRE